MEDKKITQRELVGLISKTLENRLFIWFTVADKAAMAIARSPGTLSVADIEACKSVTDIDKMVARFQDMDLGDGAFVSIPSDLFDFLQVQKNEESEESKDFCCVDGSPVCNEKNGYF